MIRKPSSTALKFLFCGMLFASLFIASCNNEKKTETEATKTDTIAPAPAPSTTDTTTVDTVKPGPVTPVN